MRKPESTTRPAARAWRAFLPGLAVLLTLLAGLRAAVPVWIAHRINRPPPDHARFRWEVQDVDVHLLSRSYDLEGVALRRRGASEPLFTAERVRSTFKGNLFTGPIAVDMEAFHPELDIALAAHGRAGTRKDGRSTPDRPPDWEKLLRRLAFWRVSSFTLHEGEIRFQDAKARPEVSLSASRVSVRADYLYRAGEDSSRWASLEAEGRFMRSGRFRLKTRFDPEASRPAFRLDFVLHGLELNTINPALMAYAGMEVKTGRLDLETHATASGGRYQGRVRSGLEDFEMAGSRPEDEGLVEAAGRKVIGVLGKVLEMKTEKNGAEGKDLPEAGFSGRFPEEVEDAWSSAEFLLKEAFREGLEP